MMDHRASKQSVLTIHMLIIEKSPFICINHREPGIHDEIQPNLTDVYALYLYQSPELTTKPQSVLDGN